MAIGDFVVKSYILYRDMALRPQKIVFSLGILFILDTRRVIIDALSSPLVLILSYN